VIGYTLVAVHGQGRCRFVMNEARLSHLPFWGPSEGFFLINSTAVRLTRMKRSSFRLRVWVNPWVNLGERFIRVNPTDV